MFVRTREVSLCGSQLVFCVGLLSLSTELDKWPRSSQSHRGLHLRSEATANTFFMGVPGVGQCPVLTESSRGEDQLSNLVYVRLGWHRGVNSVSCVALETRN